MAYQQQNIMALLAIVGAILLSSGVDSYRADFIPTIPLTGSTLGRSQPQQQQGCVWSTNNDNEVRNSTTVYPPFLQQRGSNSFSLNCNVRTLDFNYTFTRDQLETTSNLQVKCNDKLLFESYLNPTLSFFVKLRNLHELSIHSCKIRKVPTRMFNNLGYMKSLTISSLNGEWSSAVGMDIERGAFEGLSSLEKLDLSLNNIWALDKSVFCPLQSLLKLNMSGNRLSDLEDVFGSSGSCILKIQNLDISNNFIRRLNPNTFSKGKKVSELRLQGNMIDLIEDGAFSNLNQLRLLNLSSNRLVALPPSVFKYSPTLREINLSNNSISALSPEVFSGLNYLVSLDLSRNTLSSQWINGNMFQSLTRLVILRLDYNQLTYIDAKIFETLGLLQALHLSSNKIENVSPTAFQGLKNLHLLDLSSNRLSLVDSRHFANLNRMRQLYLDHNSITEIDSDAFKTNQNLQDVGLQDNKLTQVPAALNVGLEHLVTVDLGENRIESVTNDSFKGLGQLYGLRLVDNRLTEIPSGFCDHMKSLRVLNVAQNRIKDVSSAAFNGCPELRALRLDNNNLEELLPTLAPQLSSLLWLNVSENRLRWADYHSLPPTIEWLDVSYNQLESLGGPVSGKDNVPYSLRVLDASHNKLTHLDYTTIPPTLEVLRVSHNNLKAVAPDTFSRATRIRRVELMGNNLETLPLASLRLPSTPTGKPLPEFFLAGNNFLCDCEMEYLLRMNQLAALRQHPRIVDLDAITCRLAFPKEASNHTQHRLSLLSPKDFVCPYKNHCFHLCSCCSFDGCDCRQSCPESCECYHDTPWSVNIVQCSHANYSEVPSKIPMDSTELYLDGNNIPTLENHIFIGKKNLRVLHLNGSQVEVIKNKTFNGLKSLEILNIADNHLTELHGWEFQDIENVREIYLQNNKLYHISKETFVGLHYLQVLRFDGNNLHNFPVWTLSVNNYLNSVMLGNPWSCDCEFLIPFRAWVASKGAVVVDFTQATCQPEMETVGSNSTNIYDPLAHPEPQLIINMCDHNKELNFNFNHENIPSILDSELLDSNHISAEKVAQANDMNVLMSNNHDNNYPSINPAVGSDEDEQSGEMWTIFLSVVITLVIVLVVIVFLVFRKDHPVTVLPFWFYSLFNMNPSGHCASDDDEESEGHRHNSRTFISSILPCCCGPTGSGKKARSGTVGGRMADSDKLFDAYFLYSRKDEDLLLQKIAPELESPYSVSVGGHIPPPPPPHGGTPCHRLCLHYRDLCLSAENPLNTDMVMSACDFSSRIFILYSYSFVQNELSHATFRSTVQAVINRYKSKVVFIILPPFTEQHLLTIYPDLKTNHFSTMMKGGNGIDSGNSANAQITTLEWGDPNFWSKLKMILPTPTLLSSASSPSGLNSTSTISSTGSSAIFNMAHPHHPHHHNLINYNNSLSLHEYAYNTINSQHQYHRNILPFQQPPVPKHHIALTTTAPGGWQQNQNFYNNSQHSQIIPIPGYPTGTLPQSVPLMMPNSYQPNTISFNESFRRHLQMTSQSQNKIAPPNHQHIASNCSNNSQGHHLHHHHQGSHCSSHTSSTSNNNNPSIHPYQPLDANYSSSSSNEELLDHVYSTLDSPPIIPPKSDGEFSKQVNSNGEKAGKVDSSPQKNRLNNNSNNSLATQSSTNCTNSNPNPNNNGTMYFV